MHPAKRHGRRQYHDIARPQAINGLLIGVKAEELSLRRHIDLLGPEAHHPAIGRAVRAWITGGVDQAFVAALEPVGENIGHRDKFDWAALAGHRVSRSAGPSPPTANEGDLDCVILARVNPRQYGGQES